MMNIKRYLMTLVFAMTTLVMFAQSKVTFLGYPLSMKAEDLATQLQNKHGMGIIQNKEKMIRLRGQVNGYTCNVEISREDSKIHNVLVRTFNHDATNNARDFASFKRWLISQYGNPTETGHAADEDYDWAKWTISKTQDINVKTTDNCYVTVTFMQDHKVKYIDFWTLMKHTRKDVDKAEVKKTIDKQMKEGMTKAAKEAMKSDAKKELDKTVKGIAKGDPAYVDDEATPAITPGSVYTSEGTLIYDATTNTFRRVGGTQPVVETKASKKSSKKKKKSKK